MTARPPALHRSSRPEDGHGRHRSDNVWTSAGVTAGIDLTLALLSEDHGRHAAATVARQLVVYLRRSGGQSQFSDLLAAQAADSEPIRDLLTWLPDHLDHDLSVPALADRTHLSERQFRRVFKREVGTNPVDEQLDDDSVEALLRLLYRGRYDDVMVLVDESDVGARTIGQLRNRADLRPRAPDARDRRTPHDPFQRLWSNTSADHSGAASPPARA